MLRKAGRICASALCALIAMQAARAADVLVTLDITASETWTANNTYLLGTVIYVRDGATLTIEPGTVVRGLDGARPSTLRQVGRDMGLSAERVRQIELGAKRRLRRWLTSGVRKARAVR